LKRVTIDGKATPVELLVLAKYRIAPTAHGPRLTRLGSVQVVSDPGRGVEANAEIVDFVQRKASGFFIPEIWFDGLVPPAGGPFDKYAQLGFGELIVEDGWLALGFDQMRPLGEKTAKGKNLQETRR
jgi:hypothetical protein